MTASLTVEIDVGEIVRVWPRHHADVPSHVVSRIGAAAGPEARIWVLARFGTAGLPTRTRAAVGIGSMNRHDPPAAGDIALDKPGHGRCAVGTTLAAASARTICRSGSSRLIRGVPAPPRPAEGRCRTRLERFGVAIVNPICYLIIHRYLHSA
jgi:hypothetical protein